MTEELGSSKACGAKIMYRDQRCERIAMPNGRCALHGGTSTGIKSTEGKLKQKAAVTKHGLYSKAMVEKIKHARRLIRGLSKI